jgi:2-keto-4-pentenoate hydratase/2-oxohepta-3-ene-1,7-dioic acid hydratase in catechol pathway
MKLVCVGRNYAAHIAELSNARPDAPVLFIKPDSAILPNQQDFYIPEFSEDVHYEVELLVRICKVGKHIATQFAPTYYDALTVGIDFTARDVQQQLKAQGLPWEKAKGFDGSAVIGSWVPKENFNLNEPVHFGLKKNGEWVQRGNTDLMLWGINDLVSYVSQFFTLKKGDVIFTGTPAGVGRVSPNDYLVGELEGEERFSIKVK